MSDRPETTDDIIREMREQANEPTIVSLGEVFPPVGTEDVKDWADRIEAAATRERIQRDEVSFRCGDCAEFGGDCDAGDVDCIACEKFRRRAATGNSAALREALTEIRRVAGDDGPFRYTIRDVVAAALAAPPRNCDCFTSYADAEDYWHENVECAEVNGCFDAWLFAPAEGGAK